MPNPLQTLPAKTSLIILALIFLGGFLLSQKMPRTLAQANNPTEYWDIRSIDTMKYSRDSAAAKLDDQDFNAEIGTQVRNIKSTGANYVAVDTPYDERFVPYLKRWVDEARKNDIHVWFRGNFSAWEGWFGYQKGMSTQNHTQRIVEFIKNHPDLFADGDIFSSCPECENGSFGDPRQNGQVSQYRQFLISETAASKEAFDTINKKVAVNYWSMNLDVAKLVMDADTAKSLGGVVVIDHYVASPEKLIADADDLSQNTGAKVVLGEFGVPIPDLNGQMSDLDQSDWIGKVLNLASKSNSIIGLNYWVSRGGTTAIWDDSNNPKPAVKTISGYFLPKVISGSIFDEFGNPLSGVNVKSGNKQTIAGNGTFNIIYDGSTVSLQKPGYQDLVLSGPTASQTAQITMVKLDKSWIDLIRLWLKNIKFKLI